METRSNKEKGKEVAVAKAKGSTSLTPAPNSTLQQQVEKVLETQPVSQTEEATLSATVSALSEQVDELRQLVQTVLHVLPLGKTEATEQVEPVPQLKGRGSESDPIQISSESTGDQRSVDRQGEDTLNNLFSALNDRPQAAAKFSLKEPQLLKLSALMADPAAAIRHVTQITKWCVNTGQGERAAARWILDRVDQDLAARLTVDESFRHGQRVNTPRQALLALLQISAPGDSFMLMHQVWCSMTQAEAEASHAWLLRVTHQHQILTTLSSDFRGSIKEKFVFQSKGSLFTILEEHVQRLALDISDLSINDILKIFIREESRKRHNVVKLAALPSAPRQPAGQAPRRPGGSWRISMPLPASMVSVLKPMFSRAQRDFGEEPLWQELLRAWKDGKIISHFDKFPEDFTDLVGALGLTYQCLSNDRLCRGRGNCRCTPELVEERLRTLCL